jgi:hypothetical protein
MALPTLENFRKKAWQDLLDAGLSLLAHDPESKPHIQEKVAGLLRQQGVEYLRNGYGQVGGKFGQFAPAAKNDVPRGEWTGISAPEQNAYLDAQSKNGTFAEGAIIPALAELHGVNIKTTNPTSGQKYSALVGQTASSVVELVHTPKVTHANGTYTDDKWDIPNAKVSHNGNCFFYSLAIGLARLGKMPENVAQPIQAIQKAVTPAFLVSLQQDRLSQFNAKIKSTAVAETKPVVPVSRTKEEQAEIDAQIKADEAYALKLVEEDYYQTYHRP